MLKRSHTYYYQVPLQLFVCNKKFYDIMVWIVDESFIKRVNMDKTCCKHMIKKCEKCFCTLLLRELRFMYWSVVVPAQNTPPGANHGTDYLIIVPHVESV